MEDTNFNLNAYLTDLEYLVNVDSGSKHPEGVAQIAAFFCERFSQLGWQVKVHGWDFSVGPCLEIVNRELPQYDVLIMGHMDTVFKVGTTSERPFTIKEDKAFGPGVIDMKAGLLLVYYVLRSLQDEGKLRQASICVAFNSDEEISSKFSRPWLEEIAKKSDYALVFEPARANGNLVNRRKGIARYTLECIGLAAHAGVDPEKGVSAIQELAQCVLALHAKTDYETGTTVNVGIVAGGTNANVIADKAKAEVDVRFCDLLEAEAIEKLINELSAFPKTSGAYTKVSGGITRPPMNPSAETIQLCEMVEKIGSELDIPVGWTFTGGGSDGCFSASLGVPTIDGLGPVGGGAHGTEEYLEIKTIQPRFLLSKRVVEHLVNK